MDSISATPSPQHSEEALAALLPPCFYSGAQYPAGRSVGYLMKRVVTSIRQQTDARLAAHDLTFTRWSPILMLSLKGSLTVAQLAREVEVDPAAMTRVLDQLESQALVLRERSAEDRRVVHIRLTPEGEQRAKELQGVLAEVLNEHLRGFNEEEWQLLMHFLQRMLLNGQNWEQQPDSAPARSTGPVSAASSAPTPPLSDARP